MQNSRCFISICSLRMLRRVVSVPKWLIDTLVKPSQLQQTNALVVVVVDLSFSTSKSSDLANHDSLPHFKYTKVEGPGNDRATGFALSSAVSNMRSICEM